MLIFFTAREVRGSHFKVTASNSTLGYIVTECHLILAEKIVSVCAIHTLALQLKGETSQYGTKNPSEDFQKGRDCASIKLVISEDLFMYF